MDRTVGTISRGVRAPIIRQGDDLAQIVVDCVLAASQSEHFEIHDKDVIAITEAVVARSQGNYATTAQIAADVNQKFGDDTVGILFPILSRNRFAICLKGIAMGCKKVVLMLSYPSDEVGNHLIDLDAMDEKGVNPWSDVLTEAQYRELFGYHTHYFTGVDYVEYYKQLILDAGAEVEVIFANSPQAILDYTDSVLTCDIHTRQRTKRILTSKGAKKVYSLDEILTESIDGSGYNDSYGLLGSNKATEFSSLSGDELKSAIKDYIKDKDEKAVNLKGTMVTQGTTPRRLTDLIGSLADLTSGSGDKGTPIVYIQGYFDNYTK